MRLMHIYIDESGVFSNPSNKPNVASVVVALTVPSSYKVKLFNEFRKLALELPTEDGEVKGRLLDESHVARVSALLGKYDCIVEINAIDIAFHTEDQLKEYQTAIATQLPDGPQQKDPRSLKTKLQKLLRH